MSGHRPRAREASSPKGHTLIQADVWLPPGHTSPAPLPALGTSPKVHSGSGAAGGISRGSPYNRITVARFPLPNLTFFNPSPPVPTRRPQEPPL